MRRILVVSLVVLAFVASAAHAVDCDARISDGARLLNGDSVRAAADRLSETGADVRVVTVSSLEGQGNLDNLFRSYLQRCASWQAGSAVKNNLIVFMVSVGERNSIGLFFNKGGQYASLKGHWISIQTDVVKPAFKARDFDRGFVAGLDAIARVTRAAAQPAAPVVPVPVQPQQAPVVVQTQPIDLSGLWRVLGFGLGAVVVGGFGWFCFGLISAAGNRKERRKSAQLRARNAKATCSAGIAGFDSLMEDPAAQLELLKGQLLAEDIGDLPGQLEKARALVQSAALEFSEADDGVYDPDSPRLSEAEYVRIAEFFESINGKIRTAREAVAACIVVIAGKRELPAQAEKAEQAAWVASTSGAQAVEAAMKAGYHTNVPRHTIQEVASKLGAVAELRGTRQYTASIAKAAEAKAVAESATAWCTSLPTRIKAIAAAISSGRACGEQEEYIIDGKKAFESLAAEFNRSSYESIHGNGTEAIRELAKAKQEFDNAEAASSMETQDWDAAEKHIAAGTAALKRVDTLIAAIFNRKKHLEKVKADAIGEVEAAAKDIDAAHAYCKEHEQDIATSYLKEFNRVTDGLSAAREKLKHQWPDWPEIAKLAKAANEAADEVLKNARTEHEAAERKRQKAATNLREAQRARAKLREYERSHHSKISGGVRTRLSDIDRRLAEAESSSDLALIIAVTQSVANDANSAYRTAESDVRAATPAYTPSSSYRSDDSIGGGSTSFDFGSSSSSISDSIGGGSTDF